MVKIGAELPKLSQNKYGYPFSWTTLYVPFIRERWLTEKNYEANGRAAAPSAPL